MMHAEGEGEEEAAMHFASASQPAAKPLGKNASTQRHLRADAYDADGFLVDEDIVSSFFLSATTFECPRLWL